jgi:hypothetical protein
MRAPQIIMICIMTISFSVNALKHGEPRKDKYNVIYTLIGIAIEVGVLIWGGFFK